MWKWLWTEHRSRLYAVAGAILFLLSGMAVTLLSPMRWPEGGERQPLKAEEPAPAHREKISPSDGAQNPMEEVPSLIPLKPVSQPEANADWYLYITGCVRKPGVYQLPPNSRVFQLVDAAGGFDGLADRIAVNLAEPLRDGQHVHVPSKSESRAAAKRNELQNNGLVIVAQGPSPSPSGLGVQASGNRQASGLININHAPESDLVRLRGIGPTLARRIVEYRQQHGPFRTVEELVLVRGIGAAKINGLRGQATVSP